MEQTTNASTKFPEENYLVDGIVDIQKVFDTNDFQFASYMIKKYPITKWEILLELYNEKDYKAIFKTAVDTNMTKVTTYMKIYDYYDDEQFHNKVLSLLQQCFMECHGRITRITTKTGGFTYVTQHEEKYFDGRNDKFWSHSNALFLKDMPEQIAEDKQKMLEEFKLQQAYRRNTGGLTKEYFEGLLKDGDVEMLIIKLCVKLEGILKAKYHLEGDFFTMLNEWCDKCSKSEKDSRLLQKLRSARNVIVHPEEAEDKLNAGELKNCIDVVCNMA